MRIRNRQRVVVGGPGRRSTAFLCLIALTAADVCAQSSRSLSGLHGSDFAVVVRQQQDGRPGSTMTLEQLQQKRTAVREPKPPVFKVHPSGETDPLLKHRFWIPRYHQRPGSAQLHLMRAGLFWEKLSPQRQQQLEELLPQNDSVDLETLRTAVTELAPLFAELRQMSMAEDQTWDHRLRDVRGTDVYNYLLSDVQQVRTMARMLRLKGCYHLRAGEFDEAFASVADGFRLAAFVSQGESVIQKLIGLACAAITQDVVEQAIRMPDCPNLYWSLATVPPSLIDIRPAVDWETHNLTNVLPGFAAAIEDLWTEKEASRQWSLIVQSLREIALNEEIDSELALLTLMVTSGSDVAARERLIAAGLPAERVHDMPKTQVMIADGTIELRRIGDRMFAGHLLPAEVNGDLLSRNDDYLEDVAQLRQQSIASFVASLLMPAVRQAQIAETRMIMNHRRLMTMEAIRLHAFHHDGRAPRTLNELAPVPALPDPFTGDAFEYSVSTTGQKQIIELRSRMPQYAEHYGRVVLELPAPRGN